MDWYGCERYLIYPYAKFRNYVLIAGENNNVQTLNHFNWNSYSIFS